ncbi:Plasmodium exported protein (hyp6), unknown function [Plasmodium sp. DRC-Itaito]|nr:Plasmodium exported protein (hyp6), unknown function [Plasmodium sp. DRC-Itaito]
MDEKNCNIFTKRKIKFLILILCFFSFCISINILYKISSHNIYDNIYITHNRILTESYNNHNNSLRTSYKKKNTKSDVRQCNKDINNVKRNCQSHKNISSGNDNLESLLDEYHEEMKEINEQNEKPFFKRALYLIHCLDNIFIDKLVDENLQNKTSEIADDVLAHSVFLSSCCNIFSGIPILMYIIRRFDFLLRI